MFNINFLQLWYQLYPPMLRLSKHLSWAATLLKPIQWLKDVIFNDYADGVTSPLYDNSTLYNIGNRVYYIDRAEYECISTVVGFPPTNPTYWKKVIDNYIGVRERVKYNSRKLTYEWALNRWFMCSGIYIENHDIEFDGFMLGSNSTTSTTLSYNSNQLFYPNYLSYASYVGVPDYTIWVPTLVYAGPLINLDDNFVRTIADLYNLAGMQYDIKTY